MNRETVRTTAFAMPPTSPALPARALSLRGSPVFHPHPPAADQITGTAIAFDGAWTAQ